MLLTKLKDISSTALQNPINDCVISVPSYFTNKERKALLDSAAIAGMQGKLSIIRLNIDIIVTVYFKNLYWFLELVLIFMFT